MDVNGTSGFLFAAGASSWSPSRLTRHIAIVRQAGLSCRDVGRDIVARLDAPELRTLGDALLDVCERAGRSGISNAFHNPDHSRDVGVIWFNLALANDHLVETGGSACRLTARELLLGACAAFGHDIGHDGTSNTVVASGRDGVERTTRIPFRLETLAADCVCDVLGSHGVDRCELAAVRAMILSTDVDDGHDALDAALATHAPPAPDPRFAAFSDPGVRLMAAILRDSDIMPSAGLTLRDFDRCSRLIEIELGQAPMSLGPVQAETFFGSVLRGRFVSPPGKLFQARLDAIGAINRVRLADRDLEQLDLESTGRDVVAPS